jgi:hypothetical protein
MSRWLRFNIARNSEELSYSKEVQNEDWIRHPTSDVAVLPLDASKLNPNFVTIVTPTQYRMFATHELMLKHDLGVGDDVVMIGRCGFHGGKELNLPAARFGNIAMMPGEPIRCKNRLDQEGYLVEMRSITGFSGSPVYVIYDRPWQGVSMSPSLERPRHEYFLLGIDFCHLPDDIHAVHPDGTKRDDIKINGNSGFAGVIPAWKILEILDDPDLNAQRQERDSCYIANLQ